VSENNEASNLDIFFEMIDSVENDISDILDDDSNEIGGYECMVICFNSLRMYCDKVGIDFGQIEDQYHEFKESKTGEIIGDFNVDDNSETCNEIEAFNRTLEKIEESLAAFEKRCEKKDESIDEWNCVFIMYGCLRKYCEEMKTSYADLMLDVSQMQSDLEKDLSAEQSDENIN
jgi:hypothetical protein